MLHFLHIYPNMKRVQRNDKDFPSPFPLRPRFDRGARGTHARAWVVERVRMRGFTLMELLLATTLFAITAVAIYSSLAVGIKVYKRGSNISGEYSDLGLAFHRIAQDLRTVIHINDVYLVEELQKIYFFSIQPTTSGARELYKITYTWERERDYFALLRLKETYIDSLQDEHQKGDRLLDNVKRLSFDYGYLKKGISGEKEFQWKEDWNQKALPRMVRLKIEKDGEKFSKVIYCPSGKMGEVREE